ncbi:MAG: hemerythrin family protein [Magnetococcales bacterium]|nr:hemerythrin family protein [Magnetococcales bacterium]
MSQTIDWSDEYLVGLEEIDVQHKRMAELINNILKISYKHRPKEELLESMDMFLRYVKWHFGCEEILMKAYDFPDYTEHRDEHVVLINDLINKKHEMDKKILSVNDLYSFFFGWFGGHAFSADKDMAPFISIRISNL